MMLCNHEDFDSKKGDSSPGKAGGIQVSRSKRLDGAAGAAPRAPLRGASDQLNFS